MRWVEMTGRCVVTLGCGLVMAASAAAQESGKPTLLAAVRPDGPLPAPGAGDIYLEAVINGASTQTIARFRLQEGHLFATAGELQSIGIRTDDLQPDASGRIPLDSIPGLRYVYDVRAQQAQLTVDDTRRVPNVLSFQTQPRVAPTSGTGLVLNYDAYLQPTTLGGGGSSLGLFSEQRFFHPGGVFSNSGVATFDASQHRYTRLDTNWSHSDADKLNTLTLGDTVTSSLSWSRSVRLGGIQWRRNFALRPDLVTYPLPLLGGSAAVPTAVDLYVNSVRQFTGQVGSGPFVVNNAPAITGAGQAVIVVKDALGRDVVTSVPLYIDTRLLSAGLFDYAVEAGFLRNSYGLRSFDYASSPALSASLRYGLTGGLTVEGHAEATRGLGNLGGAALVRLNQAGVFSAAAAVSQGAGQTGSQATLGYQYRNPAFNVDVQGTRTFGTYRDLASAAGSPFFRSLLRATVSVPAGRTGSLAASYIGVSDPVTGNSRIASLSYSTQLGRDFSLSASAYQDLADTRARGVLMTLTMALGSDTSAAASVGMDRGHASATVSAVRTPDYAGGFGWQLQANQSGSDRRSVAQLNYRGRYGDAFVAAQEVNGHTSTAVDISGAFVFMDADVLPGRRINDAFALVSTEGVANVPVTFENRLMGRTNGSGHLLVPDLVSYENNHVAIDPLVLPVNAKLATSAVTVAPADRSGVLTRFRIETFRGAQIRLVDTRGQPLPAGSTATLEQNGLRYPVGYDGLVFIDALQLDNTVRVEDAGPACVARFAYPQDAGALPTIGPLLCEPEPTGAMP
ncbi:fimbrial biogenesis outer membrane usher protein [Ralstonia mannitolilytica]|nr:fimbrial biogenesis outer membrane usher protein [Ralstonia mannitolilytica]